MFEIGTKIEKSGADFWSSEVPISDHASNGMTLVNTAGRKVN